MSSHLPSQFQLKKNSLTIYRRDMAPATQFVNSNRGTNHVFNKNLTHFSPFFCCHYSSFLDMNGSKFDTVSLFQLLSPFVLKNLTQPKYCKRAAKAAQK